MNKSNYIVKGLLSKIPEKMIVVKKKSNYKFYSIELKELNAIIFEESLEAIEKAE